MSESRRTSRWRRKNQRRSKRALQALSSHLEVLEDRSLLAAFSQAAGLLSIDLDVENSSLSIQSHGNTHTLTLGGSPAGLTDPGDKIIAVGAPSPLVAPTDQRVIKAINNVANNSLDKFLHQGGPGAGLIVTPKDGSKVLKTLRLTTGGDSPERDPASYRLEGSDKTNGPFTLISEGALSLPNDRNKSNDTAVNASRAYKNYRLTFPKLRNNTVGALQISEIEFLAQDGSDITSPGDPVIAVDGRMLNNPGGIDSPKGQQVDKAINNVADQVPDKFLIAGGPGSGLIVTPKHGAKVVTGLRLTTGGDVPERDPASYRLEGGSAETGPFKLISEGALTLPNDRNKTVDIPISASQAYSTYRLTFPKLKNDVQGILQIAEVELIGQDLWAGTDDANVTGHGTTRLTVTTAGLAALAKGVKITDSANGSSVNFVDSGTNTYTRSYEVFLDGAVGGHASTIVFDGKTTFEGSAGLNVNTGRSIKVNGQVSTVDGALTMTGNFSNKPTHGNFNGVEILGTVEAKGKGDVTIEGRSGENSTSRLLAGVRVANGGLISGGTAGVVKVNGIASPGAGAGLNGVHLVAGSIKSSGAEVRVQGTGGAGAGPSSYGVALDANTQITAGGKGTVSVQGAGGGGTGSHHAGVGVNGGTITSSGGNVTVEGTGGGTGTATDAYGVWVIGNGTITAGGSGTILVSGVGGTGSGVNNDGVRLSASGSPKITSSKESLVVVGSHGKNSGFGIVVDSTISHTATGSASGIALIADTIDITTNGKVEAGANAVSIRARTPGVEINLGGADIRQPKPVLGVTDAELDRVTASTIAIGDLSSGALTVSADIM